MIEVIKPGLMTTVQDLGRFGYQQVGMVVAGAMDAYALQVGNLLVGNDPNDAGLEMTVMGPVLRAQKDCVIAMTGGNIGPHLDGKPIEMWKSVEWKKGTVLDFRGAPRGARAYLAVAGGLDVPVVMGSRSTYLMANVGGWQGRALKSGDFIPIGKQKHPTRKLLRRRCSPDLIPFSPDEKMVRVVLGPHDDAFTEEAIQTFLSSTYEVTPQTNRMGIKLKGSPLKHRHSADILSCAAQFGSIQVPADGQPIVLMADRQITGGYTQIATAISVDLHHLAQALSGNTIRFQSVSIEEAQELAIQQTRLFRQLQIHRY